MTTVIPPLGYTELLSRHSLVDPRRRVGVPSGRPDEEDPPWAAAVLATRQPTDGRLRVVPPDAVPRGAVVVGVVVLAPLAPSPPPDGMSATGTSRPSIGADEPGPEPGLVVDGEERTVRVDGEVVTLTRREFDLLHHLARHPGHVHSRQQLLQSVWNLDGPHQGRTVDVHVARLRRKLGPVHGTRLETLRGVGYRWSRSTTPAGSSCVGHVGSVTRTLRNA
jgi:hypothetical protein